MKKLTNDQVVKKIMDSSPLGKKMRGFVLTALQTYSEKVVEEDAAGVLSQDQFGMIGKDGWVDCAKEVLEKLKAHQAQNGINKNKAKDIAFVQEAMNYSRRGALIQLFIMSGLENFSSWCLAHAEEQCESWASCAQEVKQVFEQKYGKM